jgi:sec-independent protein translocase protein TatB
MFDIGFMELVLISVIGLLVLGPQRLPKVAAEIGKWVGRARRTATQLRRQLEREIELSELETSTPPPAPRPPAPPATPASGEVPPGPGTHVDEPQADQPEGAAADFPELPAGQKDEEPASAAPAWSAGEHVETNKTQS